MTILCIHIVANFKILIIDTRYSLNLIMATATAEGAGTEDDTKVLILQAKRLGK